MTHINSIRNVGESFLEISLMSGLVLQYIVLVGIELIVLSHSYTLIFAFGFVQQASCLGLESSSLKIFSFVTITIIILPILIPPLCPMIISDDYISFFLRFLFVTGTPLILAVVFEGVFEPVQISFLKILG